ncbi:DUF4537 domain-containing protein [Candidatus Bipolaricaulota bacterium]
MNFRRILISIAGLLLLSLVSFGQALEVGDAVWAQWRPNDWYPGTLAEETSLGFVVVFDDVTGVPDVAEDLPSSAEIHNSLIILDRAPEADQVGIGARVLAEWPDDEWYYPATVVSDAEGGLYDVVFDDRDVTTADLSQLRLRGELAELFHIPDVGDRVWSQWEPGDWYPGTLTDKSTIGFHVLFDDETEADRPASLVVVDLAAEAEQVSILSRVLAQRADKWFYPGTVAAVTDGGLYDILFDDGDREIVPLDALRLLGE